MLRTLITRSSSTFGRCHCNYILRRQNVVSNVLWMQPKNFSTTLPVSSNIIEEDYGEEEEILDAAKSNKSEKEMKENLLEGISEGGLQFPSLKTFDCLVDGVRFADLPIVTINASYQNTISTLVVGDSIVTTLSCGMIGFKNMGKRSSVAAQTLGFALGQKAKREGIKNVRVVLKGLGDGRYSTLLGIKQSGITIISITDATMDRASFRPRSRPRK